MDDKPFAYKQFFALGLMCIGFALGHGAAPTYDVIATVICLESIALIEWWMHAVDYLEWRRDYRRLVWGSEPKQIKPESRKIVDLAEKDNVWQSNSIATNLLQKDKRWQQWAQGVCNCANLTQAKWAGGGRLFSKPEYQKQMKRFIVDLILKKPAKGWNKSPRVNGLEGWRYIRDLADGRKFIPLPMKES